MIIIFESNNLEAHIQSKDPMEKLFNNTLSQFPNALRGQFRVFPYLIPKTAYTRKERGIIFTRGEKDNPITHISEGFLATTISNFISYSGGYFQSDEHQSLTNGGRIRIIEPSNDHYINALTLGLTSQFSDFGVKPPEEIRRFILSLDRLLVEECIIPHLEHKYGGQIERAKVKYI